MKKYFLLILVLFVAFALTAQEEDKLTPEQADELIAKYAQEEQELQAQLAKLEDEIGDLDAEVSSLEDEIAGLKNKKEELENKLKEMSYYVVKSGDWLALIAVKVYGPGNERRWVEIYNANKDKIKDPDILIPGLKLFIPRP